MQLHSHGHSFFLPCVSKIIGFFIIITKVESSTTSSVDGRQEDSNGEVVLPGPAGRPALSQAVAGVHTHPLSTVRLVHAQ